jgi:multiple sugar transport system substrate-binding protein
MTRTSAWEDPQVVAKIHPDIIMTFKVTGKIATPYDRPLMTAVVEARDAIGDVIVKSIESGGTADLATLTKTAKEKVDELLKNANEYGK